VPARGDGRGLVGGEPAENRFSRERPPRVGDASQHPHCLLGSEVLVGETDLLGPPDELGLCVVGHVTWSPVGLWLWPLTLPLLAARMAATWRLTVRSGMPVLAAIMAAVAPGFLAITLATLVAVSAVGAGRSVAASWARSWPSVGPSSATAP